jgi:hypothetical protein
VPAKRCTRAVSFEGSSAARRERQQLLADEAGLLGELACARRDRLLVVDDAARKLQRHRPDPLLPLPHEHELLRVRHRGDEREVGALGHEVVVDHVPGPDLDALAPDPEPRVVERELGGELPPRRRHGGPPGT